MKFKGRAAVAAVVAGALAAPAAAQQSGPVAVYWVSASTTTGMAGMMGMGAPGGGRGAGGGKRPGLGAIMGAALGGGVPGFGGGGGRGGRGGAPQYTHTLELQLGSTQKPTGEPAAEHFVPAGLQAGPSLPLVTPRVAPPEPPETYQPPQMNGQRPQGKIKIYWGCGEHAAGPPIVIDFATMGQGKTPNIPTITANPGRPPSAGRYATYGDWPNERSRTTVPPEGSLVGAHTISGDYSPPINFTLGPDHDFMAPLNITSQNPTAGGGTRITWNPVGGATGYFAWMMGGGAGGRGDDVQAVMWSSSMTPALMGAVMDYLPPSEVRRLIASRVVMPPSTTECVIPSEVAQSGAVGMLSMIAYGDEANFADPPKPANPKTPWNLKWTAKVRYKSTTSTLLGMPGMGGG